jgi:hypothetical protein
MKMRLPFLGVSAALAVKIAKRLPISEVYLRGLKGETWYDDLEDLAGADPGDGSLTRAEEAEALICLYHALPHLNLRVDDDGGVLAQEWTDDGAGGRLQKAFSQPRTLDLVRADLLSQAKCLIMGDVTMEMDEIETTLVSAVGDVSPLSGLYLTGISGK